MSASRIDRDRSCRTIHWHKGPHAYCEWQERRQEALSHMPRIWIMNPAWKIKVRPDLRRVAA